MMKAFLSSRVDRVVREPRDLGGCVMRILDR